MMINMLKMTGSSKFRRGSERSQWKKDTSTSAIAKQSSFVDKDSKLSNGGGESNSNKDESDLSENFEREDKNNESLS